MTLETSLSALPFPLIWAVSPAQQDSDGDAALEITAGPRTDMFVDPGGTAVYDNAPRLLGTPSGDFSLTARVEVHFGADFDAGVLLVSASPDVWAKLCFEFSPQREPMVVSVVTRGASDDANSYVVDDTAHWLRISRTGAAYAFHASADGRTWAFVRHFALPAPPTPVQVGFVAQSPTGDGCSVRFSHIAFTNSAFSEKPPTALRDGS